MIVHNSDGSIQFSFNTDGSLSTITRDPSFVGPIATSSSGIAGNAFNEPTTNSGSWFDNALENASELGTTIYDLGVAGYNRVAVNASRLFDSSKSVARSLQSGVTNLVQTTPLGQAATSAANGTLGKSVGAVGEFLSSTMTKVIIILVIAAVVTLFAMSFIQAKAGRFANA